MVTGVGQPDRTIAGASSEGHRLEYELADCALADGHEERLAVATCSGGVSAFFPMTCSTIPATSSARSGEPVATMIDLCGEMVWASAAALPMTS